MKKSFYLVFVNNFILTRDFCIKSTTSVRKLLTLFLFVSSALNSAGQVSTEEKKIQSALVLAGKNSGEIKKVIKHFKRSDNPLKLKAAYFLISNMEMHGAMNYYWTDALGKKVKFNEFAYADLAEAVAALNKLKTLKGGLYAKEVFESDLETIKASFLIDNIESSFKSWNNSIAKKIPFTDFCEFILPYRVTVEPLQEWRSSYEKRYHWISDSLRTKDIRTVLNYALLDYQSWFTFTYGKEIRDEPLPRLGAQHLLFRKKGQCEDVATLQVLSLRSQGLPVSYNFMPWGTTSGVHFLNSVFDADMKPIRFDVTNGGVDHVLYREPAKVVRYTYSKQPDALASFEKEENIPAGFMRNANLRDVTDEYWQTRAATCNLFANSKAQQTVYACMYRGGEWEPVWWGKPIEGKVTFDQMPKGTVILPSFYIDEELVPAGNPRINGFNSEVELKPDYNAKRRVVIEEREKYLIFRPGKEYELFIWDKEWKSIGKKTATEDKSLIFEDVPSNSLMLLVPEYSEKKERPFIITDDQKRFWF